MITDEGYLNNPYRSFRYVDPIDDALFALATEIYPRTRTSNAVALNARYFLPYRAAVDGGYRFYTDTWGIRADTFELGYTHPIGTRLDLRSQLSLLHQDERRLLQRPVRAREPPELHGARQGALHVQEPDAAARRDYEFVRSGWSFVKKGTLNVFYDRMEFDYEDFRDARYSLLPADDPNFRPAGSEPLYTFGANVFQAVRLGLVLSGDSRDSAAAALAEAASRCRFAQPLAPLRSTLSRPATRIHCWPASDCQCRCRRSSPSAGVAFAADLQLGQHRARPDAAAAEALIVDAETRELRLTLQRRVGERVTHSRRAALALHRPARSMASSTTGTTSSACPRVRDLRCRSDRCASRTNATMSVLLDIDRPAAVLAISRPTSGISLRATPTDCCRRMAERRAADRRSGLSSPAAALSTCAAALAREHRFDDAGRCSARSA